MDEHGGHGREKHIEFDIVDEPRDYGHENHMQIIDENDTEEQDVTLRKKGGYKTDEFRTKHRYPDPEPLSCSDRFRVFLYNICTAANIRKKTFALLFPIHRIYKKYQIKTDLPNDAIAGFTVGIMQLPQGMAYAMLADLPPVVGLYMSFFPVLIYFLLGTSKHISMGTVAVVSLMIGSIVSKLELTPDAVTLPSDNATFTTTESILNTTGYNSTDPTSMSTELSELDMKKIAMASSMCIMVGMLQIVFGLFKLGLVTTYMSDPLVSGFTTGAAVHVFTSQVKYVFGLNIPRYPNLLQIVYTYIAIFTNLPKTNLPTLLISVICMIILYLVKEHVNNRFKHRMKIPIPIELIVVIIATLMSHFLTFNKSYGIKVVGAIPAGLPTPLAPSLSGMSAYFSDAVIIGIVAFAQSVSLAALMAKKHKYRIDSNQEFIAYGVGNIFGSFFSCYPFAASVSRSSVQDSAGGRSQVASVFSATLVLIVILWIGPLFEALPSCVLASIIMVALRTMFLQILELRELWKISVYDFLIWLVTFVSVVILYVDLGLWIGLIFSFLTVVVRTQLAKPITLEKIEGTETYADIRYYKETKSHPGILIFSLNSPLYYANADIFVKQIYKISDMKPKRARKEIKKLGLQEFRRQSVISKRLSVSAYSRKSISSPRPSMDQPRYSVSSPRGSIAFVERIRNSLVPRGSIDQRNSVNSPRGSTVPRSSMTPRPSHPNPEESLASIGSFGVTGGGHISMSFPDEEEEMYLHHIIIDCSAMCFTDTVGGKVLLQLCQQYQTISIRVYLAGVNDEVWSVLDKIGFLESFRDNIFFSVNDAVNAALEEPVDDIFIEENGTTTSHM